MMSNAVLHEHSYIAVRISQDEEVVIKARSYYESGSFKEMYLRFPPQKAKVIAELITESVGYVNENS